MNLSRIARIAALAAASAVAAAAGAGPIPFKVEHETTSPAGSTFAGLLMLAAVTYGLVRLLRRQGPLNRGAADTGLRRIQSVRLSTRSAAHVVEHEGARFLIVENAHALTCRPLAPTVTENTL